MILNLFDYQAIIKIKLNLIFNNNNNNNNIYSNKGKIVKILLINLIQI